MGSTGLVGLSVFSSNLNSVASSASRAQPGAKKGVSEQSLTDRKLNFYAKLKLYYSSSPKPLSQSPHLHGLWLMMQYIQMKMSALRTGSHRVHAAWNSLTHQVPLIGLICLFFLLQLSKDILIHPPFQLRDSVHQLHISQMSASFCRIVPENMVSL